ncbi:MAG: complex I NDUFA9 subunit family protein [Rhodobacteraceae bacterium]|nr:complex I NDUFA9 subunit family protein [Paracoccaceae bacterium]
MSGIATVFGGSGFVGRYIVQRLARAKWRVRVAVRRPNEALFVRPYGTPGQVEVVGTNIRNEQSVARAVKGADVVINCVGILVETRSQKFSAVHGEAAGRVARLAAAAGARRLIHISSIGADPESESRYARSKGLGEAAILDAFGEAVILRPSVVFGPEDRFFNKFAAIARLSPVVPVICGNTRFQPVYVGDIAAAAMSAVENNGCSGIFELGGPEVESFRSLLQRMLFCIRRRRLVLEIPLPLARMKAGSLDILQFVSAGLFVNRFITLDQTRQLGHDNTVSGNEGVFSDLGIDPTAMDAVFDSYLYRFRPSGQFTAIHESSAVIRKGGERH